MTKHSFILTCSAALLLGAGSLASAQEGRTTSYTSNVSRQSSAEVEDIGEIGASDTSKDGKTTAAPTPKASPFRFNVGARAAYTSNARLTGNHASNDFIFFPTVEAGYHTGLGKGFSFDAAARLESGIYARHDERAFLGYSLTATVDYRPKPNLPRVFVSVEPYRYEGFDGQGRITSAIAPSVGTDWGYSFNNGNSLAFIGYTFTDYFSDPEIDNRLAHTVTVGYTHAFRPDLILQLFYQYIHEFYPDTNDRTDSRHVVGANLTYEMRKHLFVSLGASFVDNDSNQKRASYQSTGVTLGLNYQY